MKNNNIFYIIKNSKISQISEYYTIGDLKYKLSWIITKFGNIVLEGQIMIVPFPKYNNERPLDIFIIPNYNKNIKDLNNRLLFESGLGIAHLTKRCMVIKTWRNKNEL